MNDQISRQGLIEELENWYLVYNDGSWNEAIDKVKEIIKSQPPADQWNVIQYDYEDLWFYNLPDKGEEVILSYNGSVWIDTLESDGDGVYFDSYGGIKEGMAWKPAEPYEGEQHEYDYRTG